MSSASHLRTKMFDLPADSRANQGSLINEQDMMMMSVPGEITSQHSPEKPAKPKATDSQPTMGQQLELLQSWWSLLVKTHIEECIFRAKNSLNPKDQQNLITDPH